MTDRRSNPEYDKGWVDGCDAQNECNHEAIIRPLRKQLERLKTIVVDVANDLRSLTQKGRGSIPEWVTNRITHCVKTLDQCNNQRRDKPTNEGEQH